MSGRYFLDTNIFVYSFDQESPAKKQKSQYLIDQALQDGRGLISKRRSRKGGRGGHLQHAENPGNPDEKGEQS